MKFDDMLSFMKGKDMGVLTIKDSICEGEYKVDSKEFENFVYKNQFDDCDFTYDKCANVIYML